MKKIYHLGTCSTNSRILKSLNLEGIELQDIKKEPISVEQVEEMVKITGSYEALFSRKAMKYRSMGLNKMNLTEKDYKKLNLNQPNHITRLERQVYNKVKGE